MSLLKKSPWRMAENHSAADMTIADAKARAKTVAPTPNGYWKVETVPAKAVSVNGEPIDERRLIYIWFGPYEETHSSDTSDTDADKIGKTLSEAVNGPNPDPKGYSTKKSEIDGTWSIKAFINRPK